MIMSEPEARGPIEHEKYAPPEWRARPVALDWPHERGNLPPARRRPASAQPFAGLQVDDRPLARQAGGRAAAEPVGDHRPAAAGRAARCQRERPDAPAHGRAAGRAHHRAGPRARRGRQAGAQRPGRDLAVQRRRPLPSSRRPARRAARSQLLRRRPRARRRRRATTASSPSSPAPIRGRTTTMPGGRRISISRCSGPPSPRA